MRLDESQQTATSRIALTIGALSRLLVLLFTASSCLTAPAAAPAQQPARAGAPAPLAAKARAGEGDAIRPFRVNVPEKAISDLRRRIRETRWPDKETVTDRSQGVQLATIRGLVRYWQTGYDWRKAEAKLNALPQFVTNIDGVDIHFIHVRSRHPNLLQRGR